MKNALLVAMLAAACVSPCPAQKPGPHEAEFRAFYPKFLAAARANDKEKLADLIAFPVEDWSTDTKGNVQTGGIKDKADFLARYNVLFTAFMRLHIPKAKLSALDDGRYILLWRDAGAEFSFEFGYIEGTGYRVRSYDIGPT
jgi:hypothetical protein